MNRKILQNNLKVLRKQLGFNQDDFAKPLGITGSYISDIERGKSNISESILCLIEINYRVNRNWLLNNEGEPFVKEWLEDKNFLFADKGGPIKEHIQQGPRIEMATRYGENDPRNKPAAETIYNKDRPISPEDKFSDLDARLSAIEQLLKKPSVPADLDARNRDIQAELEKLKAENVQLKLMLRGSSQDFKNLVNSLKQIIEKDSPPDGERRSCMIDIVNLLTDTQKKLNNGNLNYI